MVQKNNERNEKLHQARVTYHVELGRRDYENPSRLMGGGRPKPKTQNRQKSRRKKETYADGSDTRLKMINKFRITSQQQKINEIVGFTFYKQKAVPPTRHCRQP